MPEKVWQQQMAGTVSRREPCLTLGFAGGTGGGNLGWLGLPGTVGLHSQTLAQEGASKDSISIPSSG